MKTWFFNLYILVDKLSFILYQFNTFFKKFIITVQRTGSTLVDDKYTNQQYITNLPFEVKMHI